MPATAKHILPPEVISLRASNDTPLRVDVASGTIHEVSLMTIGKARGWPFYIDAKSLDTMQAALKAVGPVQSYLKHDEGEPDAAPPDRLGEEIGLFSDYQRSGDKLVATFSALDAFRKHEPKAFDQLFELAAKAPARLGVSPVFSYDLAWPTPGGDVPTRLREDSAGNLEFSPPRPPGAPNAFPSVRARAVLSADFVDRPATNRALFREGPVDVSGKDISTAQNASSSAKSSFAMLKDLYAKFSAQPAQLAAAIKLHTENDKLTLDQIVTSVEGEAKDGEIASLREGARKNTEELAKLRADLKTRDDELAKLRTDHKAALDAKEAELKTANESLAKLRKSGSDPLDLGAGGGEGGGNGEKTIKLAEFRKLTPRKKMDFCKAGGVITD